MLIHIYRLFFLITMLCCINNYANEGKSICEPTDCSHLCEKKSSNSIDQGFVIRGSYLFYQAMEEGLDYLQKLHLGGSPATKILADVKPEGPDFTWNNGFEVGLGYIFPQREQWDVLLNWTHYQTHCESSEPFISPTDTNNTLKPLWLPFLTGSLASQSAVHWLMHFNTIDLTLGRNFFIGDWLAMHPQVSLRGAWINQGYSAGYLGANSVNNGTYFPVGPTTFMAHWQYQAGGLRFGSDAEWFLSKNFALIANLYGSIFYGKFIIEETFDGGFGVSGAPPLLILESVSFHKSFFRVRPALETEIGIRWQMFFSNEERRAMIGAYYGLSYWFNQNMLVNEFLSLDIPSGNSLLTPFPVEGDLQLHGLRIEGRFDF
ncbi:MAG TPA: hypothetical protein DCE71_08705 [Parachlamydiales bacterium]|nr:hypothetical protein [Parachlamydiales bacterium]